MSSEYDFRNALVFDWKNASKTCAKTSAGTPYALLYFSTLITDRIGEGGNAITSVRLSVRFLPLYLRNRLTVDLERLRVTL